ncbi:hypothetical protein NWP22_15440 [Anabaenopsis tanganyikae CS-531]|uniref:Transposase n=1 Tax=Anabaenopsis tanganyikae CS-531 TaxID=2785304 RepID=A0ABT6KHC6_9CYAN|nr:hypothetical protein [Anabaenopsis tanganyikae]MDH6107237.1 hypothetical protein [Anabaenopsis tanganyikae CS-531]
MRSAKAAAFRYRRCRWGEGITRIPRAIAHKPHTLISLYVNHGMKRFKLYKLL